MRITMFPIEQHDISTVCLWIYQSRFILVHLFVCGFIRESRMLLDPQNNNRSMLDLYKKNNKKPSLHLSAAVVRLALVVP